MERVEYGPYDSVECTYEGKLRHGVFKEKGGHRFQQATLYGATIKVIRDRPL